MTRTPQSFVDESVVLLVRQFGVERVRAALAKASNGLGLAPERKVRRALRKRDTHFGPTVATMLRRLQRADPIKHRLLAGFYGALQERRVLPEAQDIRYFALGIGLKDINGKSRKEMVPSLMLFLAEQSIERLRVEVDAATTISEQQRSKGFSVLTDKLLGKDSQVGSTGT
jgi:hypothetical protein